METPNNRKDSLSGGTVSEINWREPIRCWRKYAILRDRNTLPHHGRHMKGSNS